MIHNSRKQRQLKNLVKRANRILESTGGSISQELLKLKNKIQRLVDDLRFVLGSSSIRRTLGTLVLALGLTIGSVSAQQFAPTSTDAFSVGALDEDSMFSDYKFADLDGDGDFDLVGRAFVQYATESIPRFLYQENIGTSEAPFFDTPNFELFSNIDLGFLMDMSMGFTLDIVDIDDDGDYDIIAVDIGFYGYAITKTGYEYSYYVNPVVFVENTGTSTAPEFVTGQINPFGLDFSSLGSIDDENYVLGTKFLDIDGDGDLDIIASLTSYVYDKSNYDYQAHNFFWCENVGTSSEASFSDPVFDPFNLPQNSPGLSFNIVNVDLDFDGDQDLVNCVYFSDYIIDDLTSIQYFENVGTAESPSFAEHIVSPFGLESSPIPGVLMTNFVDIDGDGDSDVFHNELSQSYLNVVTFQENISPSSLDEHLGLDFQIYPNPASSVLNVNLGELEGENVKVNIYDSSGRIVFEKEVLSNFSLDVTAFANGLYSVELQTENAKHVSSIVIE